MKKQRIQLIILAVLLIVAAAAFLIMKNRNEAERWILRACAESSDRSEPWLEAAAFYEPLSAQAAAVCRSRAEALR